MKKKIICISIMCMFLVTGTLVVSAGQIKTQGSVTIKGNGETMTVSLTCTQKKSRALPAVSLIRRRSESSSNAESIVSPTNAGGNCAVFAHPPGLIPPRVASRGEYVFANKGYTTKNVYLYQAKEAITTWIPENLGDKKQVFLFFMGHSDPNGVIQGLFDVSPKKLGGWVDEMELKCNPSYVTIVIESCKAGGFIQHLSGYNRIIIASSDSDNYAYAELNGNCFSFEFFNSIRSGKTYGGAWEDADAMIDGGSWELGNQNPLIDDWGDSDNIGSGTSKPDTLPFPNGDGSKAKYIGPLTKTKPKCKRPVGQIPLFNKLLNLPFYLYR